MGYRLYEFTEEQGNELKENIEKALHFAGRAMSNIEQMCQSGQMGNRMGYRNPEEEMGYRQGVRGTGPYGMGHRDDMEYHMPSQREPMGMRYGYRDPLLY